MKIEIRHMEQGLEFENNPSVAQQRIPVIKGIESIISEGRTWYGVAGGIDPVAVPMKDFDVLMRCARLVAELQKEVIA